MSNWFKKSDEPRSWSGETASEISSRVADATTGGDPNCSHPAGSRTFITYTWKKIYGKDVRYRIEQCQRCMARIEEPA